RSLKPPCGFSDPSILGPLEKSARSAETFLNDRGQTRRPNSSSFRTLPVSVPLRVPRSGWYPINLERFSVSALLDLYPGQCFVGGGLGRKEQSFTPPVDSE